jgi:hypothetical protein
MPDSNTAASSGIRKKEKNEEKKTLLEIRKIFCFQVYF